MQVPATQAQAERRLHEFQTSRGSIPACQHILQHSRMEHARFHAALTLRQAALRDWPLLSPTARAGLLMFLMQHLFGCVFCCSTTERCSGCQHGARGSHFVGRHEGGRSLSGKQLVATLAVLLKRGWLDMSQQQRHHFFQVSHQCNITAAGRRRAATVPHGSKYAPCAEHELAATGKLLKWLPARVAVWQKGDHHDAMNNHSQELESRSTASAEARVLGTVVLEAVVGEFSPPSASPTGMHWDFHEKCRESFEARARH